MTAADTLLTLADKLRHFNDSLPEDFISLDYHSYSEDEQLFKELSTVPLKDIDLLEVQIGIELSKENYSVIKSKVVNELDNFFDWYERHEHDAAKSFSIDLGAKMIEEHRARTQDSYKEKFKQLKDEEDQYHWLCRAYNAIGKRVDSIEYYSPSDREYIQKTYDQFLKFFELSSYPLPQINQDYERAKQRLKEFAAKRDSEEAAFRAEVDEIMHSTMDRIYFKASVLLDPIAEFLSAGPSRYRNRLPGEHGTPKEINTFEKCFANATFFARFIDAAKAYTHQGNRISGKNCLNAYAYLKIKQYLVDTIASAAIFGNLFHNDFPELYLRKDSGNIYGAIQDKDPFIEIIELSYKLLNNV